ncbi:hypothetical protein PUNSTDRAFT_137500 [Punctularia strigosozonata HHB-11173 SS5]|uniref:uncharacterized protein n=1 Tax=Punctularia strigosozonata (strain HHB-11173) TaxID=741275 RepID=UPI000441632D|nr:uncharacterized protein PUNSTDRAFT_137500 [Punctularia strigosozonata HHB-11173 SS5]EIN05386.1 hypothetical protein PUNSTDRAFT_137500 [Punctularia strigosozonata HHB-11173 SS5]
MECIGDRTYGRPSVLAEGDRHVITLNQLTTLELCADEHRVCEILHHLGIPSASSISIRLLDSRWGYDLTPLISLVDAHLENGPGLRRLLFNHYGCYLYCELVAYSTRYPDKADVPMLRITVPDGWQSILLRLIGDVRQNDLELQDARTDESIAESFLQRFGTTVTELLLQGDLACSAVIPFLTPSPERPTPLPNLQHVRMYLKWDSTSQYMLDELKHLLTTRSGDEGTNALAVILVPGERCSRRKLHRFCESTGFAERLTVEESDAESDALQVSDSEEGSIGEETGSNPDLLWDSDSEGRIIEHESRRSPWNSDSD